MDFSNQSAHYEALPKTGDIFTPKIVTALLEGAPPTLLGLDWLQTSYIASHPKEFAELNPILGKHPSQADVNRYFVATMLLYGLGRMFLPDPWDKRMRDATIYVQAPNVARNAAVGISLGF